jgi:hypothetical protein
MKNEGLPPESEKKSDPTISSPVTPPKKQSSKTDIILRTAFIVLFFGIVFFIFIKGCVSG